MPRLPSWGAPCPRPPPPPASTLQSTRARLGSRARDSHPRISRKLCSGKLGISLKVLGGVTLFWAVFILGYLTGYYVHKCK